MSLLMKDPNAVLDYVIDWGAEYLGGDVIAARLWSAEPDEPGGVSVTGNDFDATTSTVKAGGGVRNERHPEAWPPPPQRRASAKGALSQRGASARRYPPCCYRRGVASQRPPSRAALGACYIVGIAPTGPWAGKAQCVAAFTGGGWRFVTPFEGLRAFVPSDGVWMLHRAGLWESGIVRGSSIVLEGQQVVGSRQAAVPSPAGGTVVDSQARTAISEILGAMRAHGLIEI
jgi:hypothetical protein